MSFMTTNDFETIYQVNEAPAPDRHDLAAVTTNQTNSVSLLEHKFNELQENYIIIHNENLNLAKELGNFRVLIKDFETSREAKIKQIKIFKKILISIQELIFEHSEDIPDGLYIQLMNALVNK